MKQEDFERLKAVCEKEGFEISIANRSLKDVFEIHKKDIWEGVEFAECVINSESYTVGKIYKINPSFLPSIKTYQDDFGRENGQGPIYFKPSTESAYIDQLKKEAFERFGEIKEGDRFDSEWLRIEAGHDLECKSSNPNHWVYIKGSDRFFLANKNKYGGVPVYCQGKWATKIKERVKVEISECVANFGTFDLYTIEAKFTIKNVNDYDHENLPNFLSSQLEKYLNGEIE